MEGIKDGIEGRLYIYNVAVSWHQLRQASRGQPGSFVGVMKGRRAAQHLVLPPPPQAIENWFATARTRLPHHR